MWMQTGAVIMIMIMVVVIMMIVIMMVILMVIYCVTRAYNTCTYTHAFV